MIIHVINKSTVLKDDQVQQWMPAFEVFVGHVSEWWSRSATLAWCPRNREPQDGWKLVFSDRSDEAGALGYHDFTPGGRPVSYVFAADELQYGRNPTIATTHEIAEVIADPWVSDAVVVSNTQFVAKEICDPCEAPGLASSIKVKPHPAIEVSDFVLPKWFVPGSTGRFDHNAKIDRPLQVAPGGYLSVLTVGRGWTHVRAQPTGNLVEADPASRSSYDRMWKCGRDRNQGVAFKWT